MTGIKKKSYNCANKWLLLDWEKRENLYFCENIVIILITINIINIIIAVIFTGIRIRWFYSPHQKNCLGYDTVFGGITVVLVI